jgi:hypothetical protein
MLRSPFLGKIGFDIIVVEGEKQWRGKGGKIEKWAIS